MGHASRSAVAARPPPIRNAPSSRSAGASPRPARRSKGGNRPMKRVSCLLLPAGGDRRRAAGDRCRGEIPGRGRREETGTARRRHGVAQRRRSHHARPRLARRFRAGRIVVVAAAELPDGTYAASKIRLLGKTRLTRVRGTVVPARRRARRVCGHERVLARLPAAARAFGGLQPGDAVDSARASRAAALKTSANRVRKVGHDGTWSSRGSTSRPATTGRSSSRSSTAAASSCTCRATSSCRTSRRATRSP